MMREQITIQYVQYHLIFSHHLHDQQISHRQGIFCILFPFGDQYASEYR